MCSDDCGSTKLSRKFIKPNLYKYIIIILSIDNKRTIIIAKILISLKANLNDILSVPGFNNFIALTVNQIPANRSAKFITGFRTIPKKGIIKEVTTVAAIHIKIILENCSLLNNFENVGKPAFS